LFLDRLDQLHSVFGNRVCTHEPRRASHSVEPARPPSRRLPKLPARCSAVLRAPPSCARASAPAGRHAQRAKSPGIRSECKAAARRTGTSGTGVAPAALPSNKEGSGSSDFGAPSPRGIRRMTVGPCLARVRCPTRRPREAEAEAEAESRRGPRLLRAKTSNPHINRVFSASGACSPCGWVTRGWAVKRHGLAYVEANPRPQCRARSTRFGQRRLRFACLDWIGWDEASGTAAQQRAAGCSMCRPQRDRSPVALGCNTAHVVATQCAAQMRHTCVAQRQMSRRAAVVTRMSAGDGFGCGADVGWGWTLSQGKGGQGIDSVPVQMWVGGGFSCGGER
jgi:hypothetical protein